MEKRLTYTLVVSVIVLVVVLVLVFSNITGQAVKGVCADSDGGDKQYEKGTVNYKDKNYTDYCHRKNKWLREFYCNQGKADSRNYICERGCVDGACVKLNEVDGCSYINNTVRAKIRELQNNKNVVVLKEGERINYSYFFVVPKKVLKVYEIINDTSSYFDDVVKLMDAISYLYYDATILGEGYGTINIEGTEYKLNYFADKSQDKSNWYITLNFPQTYGQEKMTFYCSGIIR